jgi:putative CocE/NonD family hydrolase
MNIIEKHMVEMPDGVKLFTIVQRPPDTGRAPVIFQRGPYENKEIDEEPLRNADLRGYCIITQHCRGTALSEGDFIPYDDERRDGLATLEWIRRQPFYGGEIYLQGVSYTSAVHLSYLSARPADVRGGWLNVMETERYNIVYRNGVLKTGLHGSWSVDMYKRNSILRKNFVAETFLTHPLAGITPYIFGEEARCIEELFLHESKDDPFWQTPPGGSEYRDAMVDLPFPLLLTGAFYDIFMEGMFDMWETMPAEIRQRSAFIVSPYDHDINGGESPLEFKDASLQKLYPEFNLDWYDHLRTGAPLKFIQPGKTTYYPCFGSEWRTRDFLTDGDKAWTLYLNDGTLDTSPGPGGARHYVYNPAAPARFLGGLCHTFGGMKEQDPPNSRYDILSFMGAPVEARHLFEGRGSVRLRVRSDRPDTGFYVRLSVVKGGKTWPLRSDITSLGRQHPGYQPGEEVWLDFELAPHAYWLEPGDRLRLDVSSSCFPHFLPHTNRCGIQALQTGADIARNTIVLGCSSMTLHENTQG